MLVAAFDGTISAVNPAWTALLGWTEEELIGRSFMEFIHPDDFVATQTEAARLSQGRTTLLFSNRYRRTDGDYRWLSWTAVPGDGLIHAVARDVTEERARAEELERTQEQLRQSQKMEAVGQLTGGIAHDFNNLLQGITGSLDLVQKRVAQGRTGELDRFISGAMTSANRAAALTHRLLAFSRRQPLDPKPVRANPLLASMEDLLRRTIGENIELELVLAGGLWPTLCDPNQLESAILNLVINARDAMPDGGKLTVETCNAHLDSAYVAASRDVAPGQYVCICVTDTGTGMSKDVIERAFDPFFTTKPIGQGTGLGLSMIYGFARQSEGYCKIYSEPGEGTTIKLYLPRHRGEALDEEVTSELVVARTAEDGEVVVVIEDEPVVRGLIVEVLAELGYKALEAADGLSGLELLRTAPRVDLLVTDIGLPGMNGRQLVDAARLARPELKVLFMTGYAENAAIANGFLEPGMSMITKPFAMETLATRIRDIIEGR
jgi:PAS domain S-box-containing protein